LSVEFSVEDGIACEWDQERITTLVKSILSRELPFASDYVLSLHLVGDATIRDLNAEHRGNNSPTDVLSFPLYEPGFVLPPGEPVHLGDVVVSYPRALEQAAEYGHTVEREVAYLVAHGVLHVLGYDHEEETDRLRMRAREEEALRPLGFTR
jgi:probable rRNA maturation factor